MESIWSGRKNTLAPTLDDVVSTTTLDRSTPGMQTGPLSNCNRKQCERSGLLDAVNVNRDKTTAEPVMRLCVHLVFKTEAGLSNLDMINVVNGQEMV
ncbi:hypothetical protein PoB_000244100 [Plakobranchus ocellatus]|uniref:Uncharacterized protein n=1 Tax=Plakobranchus ocellatus TaxID=259542 RepID=A0AAV3X9Y2_9GAST|nr:hypothetical protein PoB_000244100 [Plakobranchus ocellatus]